MKREIPFGYTADEIREILNEWRRIYDEVENGIYPEYEEVFYDGGYTDRYFFIGTTECVVTSYISDKKPHLADVLNLEDREEGGYYDFSSRDLEEMLCEN